MPSLAAVLQSSPSASAAPVDARTVLAPVRGGPAMAEPPGGEADVLEAFSAPVAQRAQDDFVQLVVQRVGETSFVLVGQHHDDSVAGRIGDAHPRPSLALGELVTDEANQDARAVFELMRAWSLVQRDIRAWLERVRQTVPDDELRLVIWDDTGFEIPWELFYLSGDGTPDRPAGWLGALVAVARRVTVHADEPQSAVPAFDPEQVCSGGVLAWVAAEMSTDKNLLQRYGPELTDADGILARLSAPGAPLGLVYVACHGEFSDSMTALTLGDRRLYHFTTDPLPALAASHSVVFLNACHSGRMLYDSRINSALFGFAEAFLRQGAAVVVGTAGKVETALAARLAGELLADLAGNPERSVSVALRESRARAAQGILGPAPTKANLKTFIYTFMYLCYGNPYARLTLPTGAVP